jgi:hypothetical protein
MSERFFKKLPGFVKTPAGKERIILRWVPKVFLFGSLLIGLPSLIARFYPWTLEPPDIPKAIMTIDIYVVGLMILFWTALFTVALGAFVVMVMKGPAYVADAYPLSDSDRPARRG